MKTLKQIYIKNCKKAGFYQTAIPDIWKITLEEWLEQKLKADNEAYTKMPSLMLKGAMAQLYELLEELEK